MRASVQQPSLRTWLEATMLHGGRNALDNLCSTPPSRLHASGSGCVVVVVVVSETIVIDMLCRDSEVLLTRPCLW